MINWPHVSLKNNKVHAVFFFNEEKEKFKFPDNRDLVGFVVFDFGWVIPDFATT